MELQEDSLERKRFIICYLSFYSSGVWVLIIWFKFIFVIIWAAKIGNLFYIDSHFSMFENSSGIIL